MCVCTNKSWGCVYIFCLCILAFFSWLFFSFIIFEFVQNISGKSTHFFNYIMISSDVIWRTRPRYGSSIPRTDSWKTTNCSKNISFYWRITCAAGNGCCRCERIFIPIAFHCISLRSEISSGNIWVFPVFRDCVSKAMFDFTLVVGGIPLTWACDSIHTFLTMAKIF